MGACQKAIQILPKNYQAHNALGNIYKELGRFDKAIQAYNQVLSIQPKLAESNLGDVFEESNRLEEAMQAYQQVIEINLNIAQVYAKMGSVFLSKISRIRGYSRWFKDEKQQLRIS